jgi:hypothetical protein
LRQSKVHGIYENNRQLVLKIDRELKKVAELKKLLYLIVLESEKMFIKKLKGGHIKSVLLTLSVAMLFGCGGKVVKDQDGTVLEAHTSFYPTDDEIAMLQHYCGPTMESNSLLLESWFNKFASNGQKTKYQVAKSTFPEKADEMINAFYYDVVSDVESDGFPLNQYAISRDIIITGYDKEKSAAHFGILRAGNSNESFPPYFRLKKVSSPYRELIQGFVRYPSRNTFFVSSTRNVGISFVLDDDNSLAFYEKSEQGLGYITIYITMSDKQAFDLSQASAKLEAVFIMEPQGCGTYPNPSRGDGAAKINTIQMKIKEVQLYQSDELVYQISS